MSFYNLTISVRRRNYRIVVTTHPCHCEGHKLPRSSLPVFLRKRLFGDCLGPVPMVQDRDLAPSLGRRTGGLPETGSIVKNPPCNDRLFEKLFKQVVPLRMHAVNHVKLPFV